MDNTTRVPSDFSLYDNATSTGDLQPFSLLPRENKQIWMTTHVPTGQAAGNYTGTITVSAPEYNQCGNELQCQGIAIHSSEINTYPINMVSFGTGNSNKPDRKLLFEI